MNLENEKHRQQQDGGESRSRGRPGHRERRPVGEVPEDVLPRHFRGEAREHRVCRWIEAMHDMPAGSIIPKDHLAAVLCVRGATIERYHARKPMYAYDGQLYCAFDAVFEHFEWKSGGPRPRHWNGQYVELNSFFRAYRLKARHRARRLKGKLAPYLQQVSGKAPLV